MRVTVMPEKDMQETEQKKLSLKVLRSSIPLTQKKLAELAGLNERTVTEVERKTRPVRLSTAFSIVEAINKILESKQRPLVTVQEIDWTLLNAEELA